MDAITQKVRAALVAGKSVTWGGVYTGPAQRGGYAVFSIASVGEEMFATADDAAARAATLTVRVRLNRMFG